MQNFLLDTQEKFKYSIIGFLGAWGGEKGGRQDRYEFTQGPCTRRALLTAPERKGALEDMEIFVRVSWHPRLFALKQAQHPPAAPLPPRQFARNLGAEPGA